METNFFIVNQYDGVDWFKSMSDARFAKENDPYGHYERGATIHSVKADNLDVQFVEIP